MAGRSHQLPIFAWPQPLSSSAVIDYQLPGWAKTYMAAMEKELGKAYAEPAADVRGYISYVKSQKK